MADEEKWAAVQDPGSEGSAMYHGMVVSLAAFANDLRAFRMQIRDMTEHYFEPLPRRNCEAYAEAYTQFYSDMVYMGARLFDDAFAQSFSMEVSFVPMFRDREETGIIIAEKATFNCLADFLRTEFYRGLVLGNAPRRCHNCGKYFLLTSGYNTCYCPTSPQGRQNVPAARWGPTARRPRGRPTGRRPRRNMTEPTTA